MSQPKGLWPVLFLELWERFSYIGMRSLLMLYMVQELHLGVARAGVIYGNYTAAAYLLPVAGGVLADRRWGSRRAITVGAVFMALGHLAMVFSAQGTFFAALVLLVLGTGLFKANTASLIGELYGPHDPRRDAGFSLFYLTVNVGGFAAPLVCGSLAARGNWHLGFGAAGAGMLLGLIVWALCLPWLGTAGQAPKRRPTGAALPREPLDDVARDRLLAVLLLAILGNISLWAALGQTGSSMALFADRETNLVLPVTGWQVPASWLQAANPLFIVVGMPLVNAAWRWVERRRNRAVSPVIKFAAGLALVSASFLLMSQAGYRVDAGVKVSMGWLLTATFLATTGELCVAPVGLSLVTKLSPRRFAAASMGVWYASIALANWAGGQLAGMYDTLDKGALFFIPCAVTGATAFVLVFLARPITKRMHGVR